MQTDSNINGTRIAYENPVPAGLTGVEQKLYAVATQETEDALAAILAIQERRKGADGQIRSQIYADGIDDLRDEMQRLEQSLALVETMMWRAEETNMSDDSRATIARLLLENGARALADSEVNTS